MVLGLGTPGRRTTYEIEIEIGGGLSSCAVSEVELRKTAYAHRDDSTGNTKEQVACVNRPTHHGSPS